MAEAEENLKDYNNVTFIRERTDRSIPKLSAKLKDKKLNFLYIDAGHDFDSVFDDLMHFSKLSAQNHVIQLNDCCFSDFGIKRNFGVLEAVVRFIKVQDYKPLGITNSDFSDLLICPQNSQIPILFDKILDNSNVRFCEVPDQLLGSLKIKFNIDKQANLCFI